jgi:hypothetical protein
MRDMVGIPPRFKKPWWQQRLQRIVSDRQIDRACRFQCDSLYDGGEYTKARTISIKNFARDLPQNMLSVVISLREMIRLSLQREAYTVSLALAHLSGQAYHEGCDCKLANGH